MIPPWTDIELLAEQADEAKQVYIDSLDAKDCRDKWQATIDLVASEFQERLGPAFKDGQLRNAIEESGSVMSILRQLTAPPLSQDQFKLLCPNWPKGTEKSGSRIKSSIAAEIQKMLDDWLDPRIIEGIASGNAAEVAAGPLYILARQRYETERRTEASCEQEAQVMTLLHEAGYEQQQSREIDKPWTVGHRKFMHRTTFSATAHSTAEVDLAIGLPEGRLLAIECKVSNDATNSIKRINDVLKKREAWANGYGQVLTTGAVLQGVVAAKDVKRLANAGVYVFFSHRLDLLKKYLAEQNLDAI